MAPAWRMVEPRATPPLIPPGQSGRWCYLPQRTKGFAPYLPSNAGGTIWGAGKLFGGHQLGPWTGFAVLCGYAVVLTGRGSMGIGCGRPVAQRRARPGPGWQWDGEMQLDSGLSWT